MIDWIDRHLLALAAKTVGGSAGRDNSDVAVLLFWWSNVVLFALGAAWTILVLIYGKEKYAFGFALGGMISLFETFKSFHEKRWKSSEFPRSRRMRLTSVPIISVLFISIGFTFHLPGYFFVFAALWWTLLFATDTTAFYILSVDSLSEES